MVVIGYPRLPAMQGLYLKFALRLQLPEFVLDILDNQGVN